MLIIYFDRILIGAMLTHVDGLILGGNAVFNEKIKKLVLTVSKIKRDKFRLIVCDIEKCADGRIRVSINDFALSMEEIKKIDIIN